MVRVSYSPDGLNPHPSSEHEHNTSFVERRRDKGIRDNVGECGTGERGPMAPGLDPFHGMGRLGGALRHVGW